MKELIFKKRWINLVVALVILASTLVTPVQLANASTSYIKIDTFIKTLVTMITLDVDDAVSDPYIRAAMTTGILKDGDFAEYSSYITRTDAAVLLNRADEYLHGNTVDDKLLKFVKEKRISDINKIESTKREDVAKIVAKGIIKGYGNGYYIKNRSFKGSGYVTNGSAKAMINLVLHPEKRAKLSPDGMLIRTTKLPKNAGEFDYILECYPNSFYERQFEFMRHVDWKTDTDDWAYPIDMKNEIFKTWYNQWPLSKEIDKYLYGWEDLVEKYLRYVFNVDYRTIDDKWSNGLGSLYDSSDVTEAIKTYYIDQMKANHVVVESSIIAVEPSIFYKDGDYCMRAYLKYRITAKNINGRQSQLLYVQYPYLENLKSGKWRTGIFDIRFGTTDGFYGDGSSFAIDTLTNFDDSIDMPAK